MKTEEQRERKRLYDRARYAANKPAFAAWARDYRAKNAKAISLSRRRRKYGISQTDIDKMMQEQQGKCAICAGPMVGYHEPYVDHDHQSGQVRALLCLGCNTGLGNFKENLETLARAIEYLCRFRPRP